MSFTPIKSFVDPTFFSELAKFKLETAKLSEATVDISGSMSVPVAGGRPAALRLSRDSFASDSPAVSSSLLSFDIPGKLTNLNTIEGFKELDKAGLLKGHADELISAFETKEIFKDLRQLLQFHVITFSDLKKYKYYYWFCFPALAWKSRARRISGGDVHLNEMIAKWTRNQSQSDQLIFIINDNGTELLPFANLQFSRPEGMLKIGMIDFASTEAIGYPWHLHNLVALLKKLGFDRAEVYIYRDHPSQVKVTLSSYWIEIGLDGTDLSNHGSVGWERTSEGKLMPKVSDLAALASPLDLASQAVDLNLKLMKWRAAPQINLDILKSTSCLLLGAGTLGCYVSRGLMAWGVRKITFIDNGTVSYSNPVRQPLYTLEDCIAGAYKAEAAAKALTRVYPGVDAHGLRLDVPMAGHPVTNELKQHEDYVQLLEQVRKHDVIFLLMDSRESRWLPTVMSSALGKLVINVAIGFDSYVVMRHGCQTQSPRTEAEPTTQEDDRETSAEPLGCYFCNDVVAPIDSTSRQSLDQMCTVTRPGVAQLASGHAVELFASVLQHDLGKKAPANATSTLGPVYHQLRGFLTNHDTMPIWGPAFEQCSACGREVIDTFTADGWEFVKRALNDNEYLSELSGLRDLQEGAAALELESDDGLE
ncbi:Ubiquitin-like modifier-activating enzyme ATG7 [Wickerhamiella sorbophila]|uniref:Ubiquitin-like modifier-activating enzyme ATG7 n=1 Tax=Wickerhamiella sorbophila TaxID=45607 RepID=A0A2T0FMI9_9ASCO|nr:Ubiquitin-like modifier-activating enzyme ATG7 [Wickerhamiella sorbophila]PRT56201.1 Ubiquitin-like modifier-activating enzyme ATG7 [Wickerhamiella sorbophila]